MTYEVAHKFKIAIEQMVEGLQIIDREWRYIYMNEAAARHGRHNKESLINRTMMECYPGIEKTMMFEHLKSVMRGEGVRRIENQFIYEDGSTCWFELFFEPHSNGVLIRSVDISERKLLEEQFRQAQKLEAIGQLAGGIAHDFNNQLAVMLAYCEMAQIECAKHKELASSTSLNRSIEKILNAINKSSSLTKQLLTFGRRQMLDIKVTNLNTILEDMRGALSKILGDSVTVSYDLSKELRNVNVDRNQFEQALLNLCINSRDAMPEGGTLSVTTENVSLDEEFVRLHPGTLAGSNVLVSIADSGHGMDLAVLKRVFEPFFTTKKHGFGTGLGLAMVHGFITQSNGAVVAESEVGKGTTFKIYLPAVSLTSSHKKKEAQSKAPQERGDETLLLVEDHQQLGQVYKDACEAAGYKVILASDAKRAETLMREHRDSINLLLTDIMLPQAHGGELAKRLKEIKPDLKVIFMSGYAETSILDGGLLKSGSILLQKPISLQNLLEMLRRVLDGEILEGLA